MSVADDIFSGVAKCNKSFTKLCEPMMRYFGLSSVAYVHINHIGELLNLHTHIPWMEHCMKEHYYLNDPAMVSPDNINSGFTFAAAYNREEFTDVMLKDAVDKFNLCQGCSYVEKKQQLIFSIYS